MDTAQLMRIIREDNVAEVRRALALWPGLVETATPAGEPLSHWAAREGSLAMLRLLVEYGTKVNLNAVDESGRDMLFFRRIMEAGPKKTDAGGEKKRRDFDIQAVLKALAVV